MALALAAGAGGLQIFSGIEQNKAAKKQAQQLEAQAAAEKREGESKASLVAGETAALEAQQVGSFVGRGITPSSGTPLQVLAETRAIGQQDVSNILASGESRATALQEQAEATRRQGRAALFGGFGSAGLSFLSSSSFINPFFSEAEYSAKKLRKSDRLTRFDDFRNDKFIGLSGI